MTGRRVALVTGGSRGIGRAISERLAASGTRVHFAYREDRASAAAVCRAIGFVRSHKADVGSPGEVKRLVAEIAEEEGAIHILVNNAGMIDDRLLALTPIETWEHVLRVNLTAAFLLTREVVPLMLDQSWGRIVNISSTSVHRPAAGQAAYVAAKGGLEAFTRATAAELGHKGIRVNAVAPGAIQTDMTRALLGSPGEKDSYPRYGTPADIADIVAFLVKDETDYIQGQVITADGGRATARLRKGEVT